MISVRHRFVSDVPDQGDARLAQPSAWNDFHDVRLGVRIAVGTVDAIADDDLGAVITYTASEACAVTLPQAGSGTPARFVYGWFCFVKVRGAGAVTITPALGTIDAAPFLTLYQGDGALIVSDGANYQSLRMAPRLGDMLKDIYDPDDDGIIGVEQGGLGANNIIQARINLGLGLMALESPDNFPRLDDDGKIPSVYLPPAVIGALRYQDDWDASTNSPEIPAAAEDNRGHYYVVSTAGTTDIDGETDWKIGDWLVSSGAAWGKIDNTDRVTSVAGRAGDVVLSLADIGDAGAAAALDVGTGAGTVAAGDDARIVGAVQDAGDETIAGIKTFAAIPVGPNANPTDDNQLARKKYVDDVVIGGAVPVSRTVSASGLAAGGGDLSADITITVPAATAADVLGGTEGSTAVPPSALVALWGKGVDVASAATVTLGDGGVFHITGTTTITDIDFATSNDGRRATLVFDGSLTLTHHATTLRLPTGADIATAAGDCCEIVQDAADNVIVTSYTRADGTPLAGASLSGTGGVVVSGGVASLDTNNALGIGSTVYAKPASDVSAGSTVAGSSLVLAVIVSDASAFDYGSALSGTWRNISGLTVPSTRVGHFIRVS